MDKELENNNDNLLNELNVNDEEFDNEFDDEEFDSEFDDDFDEFDEDDDFDNSMPSTTSESLNELNNDFDNAQNVATAVDTESGIVDNVNTATEQNVNSLNVDNKDISSVNDSTTPSTKAPQSNNSSESKYSLKNFDNPYELLLAIMEDKKVDLKTVVLSEITDEYLEYIRQSDVVDWDQASEFLAVAATLLEIKVKALLPKPEEPKDDELDPEKELLRKIEEYKIMKEAAEELKAIEDIDRFYKEPDESVNDYRYVLKQMNMDNLLNAFTKMMIKLQQKTTISKERKIEKDRFTVAEKIFAIKVIMNDKEEMYFSQMFDDDYSKSEVISTFQAMLELMKIQFLKVKQTALFDDILLIKNPDYVEGQVDAKIDDYES